MRLNIWPITFIRLRCGSCPASKARHRPARPVHRSIPAVQNMLLAARALGLGATLTTLYLNFEKEVEAALGLPPNVRSYALLPIGHDRRIDRPDESPSSWWGIGIPYRRWPGFEPVYRMSMSKLGRIPRCPDEEPCRYPRGRFQLGAGGAVGDALAWGFWGRDHQNRVAGERAWMITQHNNTATSGGKNEHLGKLQRHECQQEEHQP